MVDRAVTGLTRIITNVYARPGIGGVSPLVCPVLGRGTLRRSEVLRGLLSLGEVHLVRHVLWGLGLHADQGRGEGYGDSLGGL